MGAFAYGEASGATTITILHTNDIHGRVLEGDFDGMGYGKITTLVKEAREANPNTLLLDAGDTFHGLPIATSVEGESIATIMNAIGYDAMAAGNHDFNYGQERLVELNEMTEFPIMAANVKKANGTNLLESYVIKEVAGVKVGIFGLATPETLFKSHPKGVEGLKFDDPVETALKMVAALEDKVDIIIALGHLGIDEESVDTSIKVIESVPGIDVFVDGHSHSVLTEGKLVGDTLLVSAGEYGKYLGVVELVVEDGSLVSKKANLISKEDAAEVEEDEAIMEIVKEINDMVEAVMNEVVGEAAVTLDGERAQVRAGETNLGNLITDVFIEATGADVALTNGGGIRASITAGEITRKDIITVFPFGNSLEVKKVTGKVIKEALESGTDAYPEAKGAFPHVAGMTYKIDLNKPVGNRIVDIMVNGSPLELEKEYTLATNDFIAAGGDGYTMIQATPTTRRLMAMDEALISYIQERGVIAPAVEGRITAIELNEEAVEEVVEEEINVVEPIVEEPAVEEPAVEEPHVEEVKEEAAAIIYVVQPGDWLSTIAMRYNTTWEHLQEINGIKNPNLIFPGQKIIVH